MNLSSIERAARAFALAASGSDEWDSLDAATRQQLKEAVGAALATMRKPPAYVTRAGARQSKRSYRSTAAKVEAIWQAMIDATIGTR